MALNTQSHYKLCEVIAEEAFMAFVVFDPKDFSTIQFNRLARQLFEVPEQDLPPDLKMDQFMVQEAMGNFRPLNENLFAHEGLYQDVLAKKKNGQNFIANIGVKHLNLEGRPLCLLMVQDITLQKKLQRDLFTKQMEIKGAYEELLAQNRQLKELDLAKNRFIALTTHELRTPLSAMYASAEILQLKLYDNEEQMNEFIQMIYQQGQHLLDLVNDILDLAKIQAGRMDFFVKQDSPVKLIADLMDEFTSMAEGRNVTMKLMDPPENLNCYYDEIRLRQVLSNIINNAIKYNKESGSVTVRLEDSEKMVKIFVTDTGHGIPEDQYNKVFNEFETLGQVAQHHKGTGLGMPISRRLMEGMGGTLQLESESGVGSNFWVEIPKDKVLAPEMYRPRPSMDGDLAA